jgi:hypothetical protein
MLEQHQRMQPISQLQLTEFPLICKNIASITYEKGNIAPYKEKGPFKSYSDHIRIYSIIMNPVTTLVLETSNTKLYV